MTPFSMRIAALIISISYVSTSSCLPTVVLHSGIVIGTTTSVLSATATVNKFLGIPFAASPPQRFSPPSKVAPWHKPLNASAFKPACIQQFDCESLVILFSAASFAEISTSSCGKPKLHHSRFRPTRTSGE